MIPKKKRSFCLSLPSRCLSTNTRKRSIIKSLLRPSTHCNTDQSCTQHLNRNLEPTGDSPAHPATRHNHHPRPGNERLPDLLVLGLEVDEVLLYLSALLQAGHSGRETSGLVADYGGATQEHEAEGFSAGSFGCEGGGEGALGGEGVLDVDGDVACWCAEGPVLSLGNVC
jgi:hypothetical protein